MGLSVGYSPKVEKFIPLGDFPLDKYLIIARQAIENLGWNLSHISERGLIAYTPISLHSYSEEISIRIENNFAIFKSECVGIQMLFTDYGKNAVNMEKFFHEFEYVEFHLQDVWEESLAKFHDFVETQDTGYFEKAPLTAKNKIKNVFYLLLPQKNYTVTPILILINAGCFVASTIFIALFFKYLMRHNQGAAGFESIGYFVGANSREHVLNGHFWRLITYQFVHASFLHIFFNMYALAYIGLMIEHKLGSKKLLFIYLASGVCGGLLSIAYHDAGYMVGASGSIMGLFGAFLALLYSKGFERNATKALLISTVLVVAIMLLNGLKGSVDNAAHVGGLIAGFIACYIVYNDKFWKWNLPAAIRYAMASFLVVVFACVIIQLTPRIQTREYIALTAKYEQNWKQYYSIFKLPADMPTGKKLRYVQTNGIDLWKKNDSLVNEMLALQLTKSQRNRAEFHAKVVAIQSKIAVLLYKECAESTKYYRREIRELTRELNNLTIEEVK
jgi:rhomboid protease GluP